MADEQTKKVFVRLTKGFPQGVTHRRAGLALSAGPEPVEAQVTKEQLEALEADPSIEIVSNSEAKRILEFYASTPEHASAEELQTTNENQSTGGRTYEGDDNGQGTGDDGSNDGSSDDLEAIDKLNDLKAIAEKEGVDTTGLTSKASVREAIQAKRAENTSTEE